MKLYKLPDLIHLLRMSKSTIYLKIRKNQFPRPSKYTDTRISVWDSEIIHNWMHQQLSITSTNAGGY